MKTAATAILMIALLALPSAAQEFGDLDIGDRVRVFVDDGGPASHVIGEVLARRGEILVIAGSAPGLTLEIPQSSIHRIEKSLGVRPIAESAVNTAASFGFLAAAEAPILSYRIEDNSSVGGAALAGGLIGAVVGAIYGIVFPGEAWTPVWSREGATPAEANFSRNSAVEIEGGWGLLSRPSGSGTGPHVKLGARLATLSDRRELRGEVHYQSGNTSGSPDLCFVKDGRSCVVQTSSSSRMGVGVTSFDDVLRTKFVGIQLTYGLGYFYSDMVEETIDNRGTDCPAGEDLTCRAEPQVERKAFQGAGPAANVGVRLSFPILGGAISIDARAYAIAAAAGNPSLYAPLSAGFHF